MSFSERIDSVLKTELLQEYSKFFDKQAEMSIENQVRIARIHEIMEGLVERIINLESRIVGLESLAFLYPTDGQGE